jgi:hypothetical protein
MQNKETIDESWSVSMTKKGFNNGMGGWAFWR